MAQVRGMPAMGSGHGEIVPFVPIDTSPPGVQNRVRHISLEDTTMLVSSLLSPEAVATGVSMKSKQEVLERLVDLAAASGAVVNRLAALNALLEREELCSTAIGHGISIPHATQPLPGVFKGVALSVVRLERGLDLDAPDGEPVRLFVLMGTDDRKHHLQVLGRLARLFRCDQLRDELMHAPTSDDFSEALAKADKTLNRLNGAC